MRKEEFDGKIEEGLRRFRIIVPLLDDESGKCEQRKIRRRICDREGLSLRTLRRWVATYKQNGFNGLLTRERRDKGGSRAIKEEALKMAVELRRDLPNLSAERIQHILVSQGFKVARSTLERLLRQQGLSGRVLQMQFQPLAKNEPSRWMLRILQNAYSFSEIKSELGEINELKSLLQFATFGKFSERNMALSILACSKGIPIPAISQFLLISPKSIYRYFKLFKSDSFNIKAFAKPSKRPLKSSNQVNKDAVFSLLHHPPKEFEINRTSWKLMHLKYCLEKQGIHLSKNTISKIIKNAGYTWKKAKTVLTSNDPAYKQKLDYIKGILSSLGDNERFFSCDEFGPFAIKMMPGRKLVAPDEYPQIPQYQRCRGSLILTGALELSTNQITHFYSEKKNTDEMIRLLNILLKEYKVCRRIYISWDAASWHISKKLSLKVEEINDSSYREKYKTPEVVLAPLPASAQFLNVIESVFSGFAKAIIHNSNYESVDEAKIAIDRYFSERNKYFQDHPKVAGNKIWGCERFPSQFDEAQNFKDTKYSYLT
jgi:transposase